MSNRFNITIDHSPRESDESSITDEEGSSGVHVSPPSVAGSHDYQDSYDDWAHLSYPDELKPSDSASRPRTSHRSRNTIHGSRSGSGRRHPSRRHTVQDRETYPHRPRRHHSPESPESVDSGDEYVGSYARPPQERRYWPPVAPGPTAGYAHSSSSGPTYSPYPHSGIQHSFTHPGSHHPPSDQLVRLGHPGQLSHPAQYGNVPPYGYGPQYPHSHSAAVAPTFGHDHLPGHPGHHPHHQPQPRGRDSGHSPPQPPMSHPVSAHGASPYGPSPFSPPDLIPYSHTAYFPYNQPYPMVPGIVSPSYFNQYPRVSSPSQKSGTTPPPTTSPADTPKDDAIARLEKLILDERAEREAKEAARQAAIEKEAAEKAAREERAAAEKKIADEAAARATAIAKAEAEKKAAEEAAKAKKAAEEAAAAAAAEAKAEAEKKAAEEAAKAKKEAEEAAAAAAAEAKAEAEKKAAEEAAKAKKEAEEAAAAAAAEAAAAAAAANPPPPEKKKPIKFKDAVGRKFSFPFHLCCTWQGMEELIRQAFLHVEVIGPHVAEGHYDLVGPNGDIILPQVWETVIEPDWTITMHMWPIPEKPKTPDPPPPPPPPLPPAEEENPAVAVVEEPKKKPESAAGAKKSRQKVSDPSAFAMWMVGGKPNRPLKVEKKPK